MGNDEQKGLVPLGGIEAGYVMLPFDQEQFKDFIKSLLGSPQAISKTVKGSFAIELGDLRNLYQLVMQRVTQQNEGVLAQFTARIIYSDDSSAELTSIEELLTYNEIRPIVSKAVHLKWDFVVRFQDKQVPEKQRIQVSFISSGTSIPILDEFSIVQPLILDRSQGYVTFRIEHTARTWGADIEAMLTHHIQSVMNHPPRIKAFVSNNSGKISLAVGAGFFLSCLVGAFFTTRRFSAAQVRDVRAATTGSGVSVDDKLEYLTNFVAGGVWSQYYFAVFVFIIIALFIGLIFGIWTEMAAGTAAPSFVLLTREAQKDRAATLRRLERKWFSFVLSVSFSLVSGIVSNVLFSRFFT